MSAVTQAPPTWAHNDPDINEQAAACLTTARNRAWSTLSPIDFARQWRAFWVLTLDVARLTSIAPPTANGAAAYGGYRADDYKSKEHLYAASTLLRTPMLLAPAPPPIRSIGTNGGGPILPLLGESALPPVVLVAAVIGATACILYAIDLGAKILDSHLQANAKSADMVATQADLVKTLENHTQRERQAGKVLPFDKAELDVVHRLLQTQKDVAARETRPLPTPFDGAVSGLNAALMTGTTALVALGAVYILTRDKGA